MHDPSRRLPGERAFALLLVALSLFLFITATRIDGAFDALSSPGAFPIFATGTMLVTAVIVAWRSFALPASDEHGWRAVFPGFVIFMAVMMLFYALALRPVGFLPTSFVFLAISTRVMMRCSWGKALGLSALSLILVYVVFRLVFTVLMPEGIVPERTILAWLSGLFGGGKP